MSAALSPKENPASEPVRNSVVPESVKSVLRSNGTSIPVSIRGNMESKFGRDFSNVQVHSNSTAQASAADINAKAYSFGNHVVMGQPQYISDYQILSHELTHVSQSNGSHSVGIAQIAESNANELEASSNEAASAALVSGTSPSAAIQRMPRSETEASDSESGKLVAVAESETENEGPGFQGIKLFYMVDDRLSPPDAWTLHKKTKYFYIGAANRQTKSGIYPLYFTAARIGGDGVKWVISPDSLSNFISHENVYATVGNTVPDEPPDWMKSVMKANASLERAILGDADKRWDEVKTMGGHIAASHYEKFRDEPLETLMDFLPGPGKAKSPRLKPKPSARKRSIPRTKAKGRASTKKKFKSAPKAKKTNTVKSPVTLPNNKIPAVVMGRRVRQNNKLFKDMKPAQLRKNIEKMRKGEPPIVDGKPVELHHLTGTEPGSLAELTYKQHKKAPHGMASVKGRVRQKTKVSNDSSRYKKDYNDLSQKGQQYRKRVKSNRIANDSSFRKQRVADMPPLDHSANPARTKALRGKEAAEKYRASTKGPRKGNRGNPQKPSGRKYKSQSDAEKAFRKYKREYWKLRAEQIAEMFLGKRK